jgi:DNA-binding protein HU-beta
MKKVTKTKPMSKKEIITYFVEKFALKKVEVESFLNEFVSIAYKETKKEGSFVIPGLGKLVLVNRKARMGRNPATGESIKIKAKKVVKFRVSKVAKDNILNN